MRDRRLSFECANKSNCTYTKHLNIELRPPELCSLPPYLISRFQGMGERWGHALHCINVYDRAQIMYNDRRYWIDDSDKINRIMSVRSHAKSQFSQLRIVWFTKHCIFEYIIVDKLLTYDCSTADENHGLYVLNWYIMNFRCGPTILSTLRFVEFLSPEKKCTKGYVFFSTFLLWNLNANVVICAVALLWCGMILLWTI